MKTLIAIALSTVIALSATAEEKKGQGVGPGNGTGSCHADREKFCKGVEQGEGHIVKCLKEHENELSAECKAHAEQMKAKFKEMKEECKADAEALCKDTEPGGGRIMKCLHENADKIQNAQCKEGMSKKPGMGKRKGKK